jgi:predicted DNA binding protein
MFQLQFRVTPERWIGGLCTKGSAKVRVLGVKVADSQRHINHFVDISSAKTTAEDLTKELQGLSDVIESDVARLGTNRVVGAVTSNDCVVCSLIMESKTGFFVAPAATETDCQMSYNLFMSSKGTPRLLQSLHEAGISYKISELEQIAAARALTTKQERTMKSALELGYYDYPKRVSTEGVSKMVGLSVSTVSETLRRAEKKIINGFFETA